MKLRLEDLPEPLRREVEALDRRERRRARMEMALFLAAVVAFGMGAASLLGVLLGR